MTLDPIEVDCSINNVIPNWGFEFPGRAMSNYMFMTLDCITNILNWILYTKLYT